MPDLVDPELPAPLGRVVDVLGNSVRLAILHWLTTHGPAPSTAIAEGTGVNARTTRHHLVELERLGVLEVDPPRTERDVRTRRYNVNADAIEEVIRTLDLLKGGDGSHGRP